MRSSGLALLALVALVALPAACSPGDSTNPDGGLSDGAVITLPDGATLPAVVPVRSCRTTFRYRVADRGPNVRVAGEWNGFDPTKGSMKGPDPFGWFSREEELAPGAYGYKFVLTNNGADSWVLDPSTAYTKSVGGTENSVVEVADCKAPLLTYVSSESGKDGRVAAVAQYWDGGEGAGLDVAKLVAQLDGQVVASTVDAKAGRIAVALTGVAKGKHRLVFQASDLKGRAAEALHVPLWIEDEPFDFRDGAMYFAFTDRFRNGDPGNDAPTNGVAPLANYAGGDFAGITLAINEGYLDGLGVRSIWISPPFPNPDYSQPGGDGRQYTGYHGYWPIGGRSPQKRFGDVAAFKAMVAAAHAHGIRILVDTVLNHVHKDHPYWKDHQKDGWFNGDGDCVCGGNNCDWDTHRLDCWFTNYLPDVNYGNFDALRAAIDDAVWWARELDVDGFRVDAVKHFPEAVSRRLRGRLRDTLEHGRAGLYYLVGETFTGGDDAGRYLIRNYLGDTALHAQFDFPLYWNILGTFAQGWQTMRGLDVAVLAGEGIYGGAPMSPFLGNHDVPRFISYAGMSLWMNDKEQAWQQPPASPGGSSPYEALRLAIGFTLTQPGVPLIYYGDEYGLPGAGDPDNRRFMKWSGLSGEEAKTLELARKVGAARRGSKALRRGARYTMWVDDDLYVYARALGDDTAIVILNRGFGPRAVDVPVRPEAPIADGTALRDLLGGTGASVAGGKLRVMAPARSVAIVAK